MTTKAHAATVKMMRSAIAIQLIANTIERECGLGDTPRVAPDHTTKIVRILEVVLDGFIAQYNVAQFACQIWDPQR
ncbi:hypothetical protein GCM10007052_20700 [Halioglobus japonicus]|nr:hypothetical protein GCM10007052_20700 [Halioglobus japonicus]